MGIWMVNHRGTGVPFLLEVCQPQGLPLPESTLCSPAPDLVLPAQHSAQFRLRSFAFFMSVFKRILEAFPERIFCFRMDPELPKLQGSAGRARLRLPLPALIRPALVPRAGSSGVPVVARRSPLSSPCSGVHSTSGSSHTDRPSPGKMFLVGLTGGIASGKSSVIQVFQQLGCAVIDVDVIARHGALGAWVVGLLGTALLGFLFFFFFFVTPHHLLIWPFRASEEGKAFLSALSEDLLGAPCLSSPPLFTPSSHLKSPLTLTSPHDQHEGFGALP